MSLNTFDPTVGLTMTDSAIKHIQSELNKASGSKGFRLYLETSGCSGFMYETELTDGPKDGDETFPISDGIELYVPKKDLPVLNGTVIDFIKVGLNSMFQFKNPNVTGECGCGESFSVTEEA